jgi:hypothetical protein
MEPDEKADFQFQSFFQEISRFKDANFRNTLPDVSQKLDWALLGFVFIIALCCQGALHFQIHTHVCVMM